MSAKGMPVEEPVLPLRFGSRASRRAHACKHVLAAWQQERWRRVLPVKEGVCVLAREDWLRGVEESSALRRVMRAYEQFCGESLAGLCERHEGHVHMLKQVPIWKPGQIQMPKDGRAIVVAQKVYGWDAENGIFLVAAKFVRKRRNSAYVLKTGYRPDPSLRGGSFRRKAREWVERAKKARSLRLLADHGAQS